MQWHVVSMPSISNMRESGVMEEREAGKETCVVSMCKVALKMSPTTEGQNF